MIRNRVLLLLGLLVSSSAFAQLEFASVEVMERKQDPEKAGAALIKKSEESVYFLTSVNDTVRKVDEYDFTGKYAGTFSFSARKPFSTYANGNDFYILSTQKIKKKPTICTLIKYTDGKLASRTSYSTDLKDSQVRVRHNGKFLLLWHHAEYQNRFTVINMATGIEHSLEVSLYRKARILDWGIDQNGAAYLISNDTAPLELRVFDLLGNLNSKVTVSLHALFPYDQIQTTTASGKLGIAILRTERGTGKVRLCETYTAAMADGQLTSHCQINFGKNGSAYKAFAAILPKNTIDTELDSGMHMKLYDDFLPSTCKLSKVSLHGENLVASITMHSYRPGSYRNGSSTVNPIATRGVPGDLLFLCVDATGKNTWNTACMRSFAETPVVLPQRMFSKQNVLCHLGFETVGENPNVLVYRILNTSTGKLDRGSILPRKFENGFFWQTLVMSPDNIVTIEYQESSEGKHDKRHLKMVSHVTKDNLTPR